MKKYRVYFYGGVSRHGNYGVDYMIAHVNQHTEFNPVCGCEEEVTDEIYAAAVAILAYSMARLI